MNYFAAHKILDKIKDGAKYPIHTINKALELTGDRPESHEGLRGEGVDPALQGQSERFGDLRCPSMVA